MLVPALGIMSNVRRSVRLEVCCLGRGLGRKIQPRHDTGQGTIGPTGYLVPFFLRPLLAESGHAQGLRFVGTLSNVFGYSAWLTRPIGAGNDMIVKAIMRGHSARRGDS